MATVYTQAGEEEVTDFTTGTRSAPSDYFIGWGTDGTTAAKSDSSLYAEASESRVTATVTEAAADKAQFKGTLTADSAKTIREVGLFDSSSAGTMFIRQDHTADNLASGDKIEYTVTLEQT